MLRRAVSPNGVVYYLSPVLESAGVPHAFSTRIGGVSPAPFDSMNLGNPNGCDIQDDYDHIWANYRRLQAEIGCEGRELCRVHQVHGSAVEQAFTGRPFDTSAKADAIVTDDPARVLSVRVADCVPVLLATADGRTVAAVHAGWRGVVAGVAVAALQKVRQTGGGSRVLAAIGPSIGFDAFEVGGEVLAEFERFDDCGTLIRRRPDGKGTVDLRKVLRQQLIANGVAAGDLDVSSLCTFSLPSEFYSHRRDKGVTGRMAALIGSRA